MNRRPVAPILLGALLLAVTGCVAVPSTPDAAPARPPAGLAPADDRPPAPLPSQWPAPTQAPPREALASTEPLPPSSEHAAGPGPGRDDDRVRDRRAPAAPHGRSPSRQAQPPRMSQRQKPRAKAKAPQRTVKPRPAATAGDLRQLCRDAERVQIPYDVHGLCRRAYGR